ncbi:putative protein kinase RLK-Pelle-L-LEC family [Helianthus annuus]|nr:putative protein kinase RLK-Pelle-L-LEC family [Helianthus annuus]
MAVDGDVVRNQWIHQQYLFCCLYSHNVAPEDKFIALVTTKAETDDPEIKLKPGVDLLGPVDDVFYETLDRFEPRDDGAADSCFVSTASRRIRIICGLYLVIKPITIASSPLHTSGSSLLLGFRQPHIWQLHHVIWQNEFLSEVSTIGRLRHRNLVQLLGWFRNKGELLLVYEFMANGSLDKCIYSGNKPKLVLSWEQRFKVIKDVANGLLYLPEGWEKTVVHRDIKAGNVLLDSDLNGKLGDFGLAKLYEHRSNPVTTKVVGTLGYLAPELTRMDKPTTGSDVYAFRALLLEVVCERRSAELKAFPEELILVDWVWDKWRGGCLLDVVDSRLKGEFNEAEAGPALGVGDPHPRPRPNFPGGQNFFNFFI